jgi:hypothetical protein
MRLKWEVRVHKIEKSLTIISNKENATDGMLNVSDLFWKNVFIVLTVDSFPQ